MDLASIGLLAVAAALHAILQALIKGARRGAVFSWLMLGASTVIGIPALALVGGIDPASWLIVTASGVFETLYFMSLTKAYSLGDLSSVYPIARGSAPLLTLLWSFLFLGERPTAAGLFGIIVIAAGIYLSRLERLSEWNKPFSAISRGGSGWALLTGVFISGYTTIDKIGAGRLDPFLYLYLVLGVAWIVQMPIRLAKSQRASVLEEIGRTRGGRWRIDPTSCLKILAGMALGFTAYALVLLGMRGNPVSYVAPIREMSVVLGAWIGVRIMKERGGSARILAAALIFLGILVIAVGG